MSAESMPATPVASERSPRRSRCSLHLQSPFIFTALALAFAPASVCAAGGGTVMVAEAGSAATPAPEPDPVSAADRLRVDPLETVPVPTQAVPAPELPSTLTKDERTIARHITRSYRVDSGSSERFVYYAYKAAREFRLDPHLILAVMAVESGFDANARSTAGAKGLMQVHLKVHRERFEPFGGPDAVYDPPANIKVGAGILREYVSRYGDVAAGLKAYVGAALLPSDGGYGSKVLNRQAQFDAVLKAEVAPAKEPRAEGPIKAASAQASGAAESSGASAELPSSRLESMDAPSLGPSSEAKSREEFSEPGSPKGRFSSADASDKSPRTAEPADAGFAGAATSSPAAL